MKGLKKSDLEVVRPAERKKIVETTGVSTYSDYIRAPLPTLPPIYCRFWWSRVMNEKIDTSLGLTG
jgi:hypothetical protein